MSSLNSLSFKLNSSHIFMLYVAEEPEFPVGSLGVDEGLERPIQLLDGHLFFGLLVDGRTKGDQTHSVSRDSDCYCYLWLPLIICC